MRDNQSFLAKDTPQEFVADLESFVKTNPNKTESVRIQVWRNRIKQNGSVNKIISEACDYEGHLDAMSQTDAIEQEIREVVAFIKEYPNFKYEK